MEKMILDQIKVNKDEVLNVLKKNKQKHDLIYEAAVSGFWENQKNHLDNLSKKFDTKRKKLNSEFNKYKQNFEKRITEKNNEEILKSFYFGFQIEKEDVPFPKSYSDYYNKVIRKLELCVTDEIYLNDDEFSKYIMNDWEFKKEVKNYSFVYQTGATGPTGSDGVCGNSWHDVLTSGCSDF